MLMLCFGCNAPKNNVNIQEVENKTDSIIKAEVVKEEPKKELISVPNQYKVISLDYTPNNWFQRVFVEAQLEVISESKILRKIICDLDSVYEFEKGTSVSFFTEGKYAKYIDETDTEEMDSLEADSFFKNWKNEIYIGEFECDSNKLELYPVSETHDQLIIEIRECN